jgi:hypothetical protein
MTFRATCHFSQGNVIRLAPWDSAWTPQHGWVTPNLTAAPITLRDGSQSTAGRRGAHGCYGRALLRAAFASTAGWAGTPLLCADLIPPLIANANLRRAVLAALPPETPCCERRRNTSWDAGRCLARQCAADLRAPTLVRVKRYHDRPRRGRHGGVNVRHHDRGNICNLDRPAHFTLTGMPARSFGVSGREDRVACCWG